MRVKRPIVQISVVVAAIHTSYWSFSHRGPNTSVRDGEALKVVVEKVSLRVALMQGSVGPKCSGKPSKCTFIMKDTKGNQVNIPELGVAGRLSGSSESGYG